MLTTSIAGTTSSASDTVPIGVKLGAVSILIVNVLLIFEFLLLSGLIQQSLSIFLTSIEACLFPNTKVAGLSVGMEFLVLVVFGVEELFSPTSFVLVMRIGKSLYDTSFGVSLIGIALQRILA